MLEYYDEKQNVNELNYNHKKLEHHFLVIIGQLNCLEVDIWLKILEYAGLLNKINTNSENNNNFKDKLTECGREIVSLIIQENNKIENIIKEKIDLKEFTIYDWLVLRENSI